MLLKTIAQTLQANPIATARLKGRTAASVCEEMEELEKTVVDCISRLKAGVMKGEAAVASECEHTEQVIEGLRADVGVLETKIRETEDSLQRKTVASQRMKQTFAAKIVDLLNEVKQKDESLDSRGNEIEDLKSKLDIQAKQVIHLEQALREAKAESASATKRAEQIAANSSATITRLEGQLMKASEIVRENDSAIKELEQSHNAKIQDLENQIRTKEKDLADRHREVSDLRSEITALMKGIKEMSCFFKQAEALANNHSEDISVDVQPQNIGAVNAGKQPEEAETKPTASQPVGLPVTSNPTDASHQETVPPSFFDSMSRELGEAFGPMAPVILRDHLKAVGESMEKFPKTRVAELLDNITKEIANETVKSTFREHLDKLHIVEKIALV
jgi:myosin heavy subunit